MNKKINDPIGDVLAALPLKTMTWQEIDAELKRQLPDMKTYTIEEYGEVVKAEEAKLRSKLNNK